ncbi:MAG TPA: peptide chain release factor N(5)-glutamine methyltransferase [Saprospiraceae bacterium]|nr:peptide chain release factor N(5)-glutamine methyltransferase [Saprospiraceae bacterium]
MAHYKFFAQAIEGLYDKGEAQSIRRIVQEDVFHGRPSSSLSDEDVALLKRIEGQLLSGRPIQYILGMADFYGLKLQVNESVLIPRQDTETVVYEVIHLAKAMKKNGKLQILDIGTGSGCMALALKKELDLVDVLAVDVSIKALNVARKNNRGLQLCVQFEQLDILDENQWGRMGTFDIIVSNPPYIPPSEKPLMPSYVKDQEPDIALFVPQDDALLFYRKIALFGCAHLSENGFLAFEINEFRAMEIVKLLEQLGYRSIAIKQDLNGADRVVYAKKPFPQGAKKA